MPHATRSTKGPSTSVMADPADEVSQDKISLHEELECYVWQCYVYVSLRVVKGYSVIYMLTDIDASQYTMLIFGFSSLHMLRQYVRDRGATNICNYLLQLYILIITIPQIHKNTLICITSYCSYVYRVPPLLVPSLSYLM